MTRMEFIEKAIELGTEKSVFPIDKKSARNFCYLIFHMLDEQIRFEGEVKILDMIRYSNASFKENRSFYWKEYDGKDRQQTTINQLNPIPPEDIGSFLEIAKENKKKEDETIPDSQ